MRSDRTHARMKREEQQERERGGRAEGIAVSVKLVKSANIRYPAYCRPISEGGDVRYAEIHVGDAEQIGCALFLSSDVRIHTCRQPSEDGDDHKTFYCHGHCCG